MLVLSRKENEQIVIGENIVVKIINVKNGRVRLGIEAPRHLPVHRQEVYDAIRKEKSHGN